MSSLEEHLIDSHNVENGIVRAELVVFTKVVTVEFNTFFNEDDKEV